MALLGGTAERPNYLQKVPGRGATSTYLEPPKGKTSFDLLKMAREELVPPLRAAINKARKDISPVLRENIRVCQNGRTRPVNEEVIPLKDPKERCFLVLFETPAREGSRAEAAAAVAKPPAKREEARRLAGLERELEETRDYLQSIQEQYEATHEELQASNEETQSANEELQRLNEEMANWNAELSGLNADLRNLHVSINTAILVLGRTCACAAPTGPSMRPLPWAPEKPRAGCCMN